MSHLFWLKHEHLKRIQHLFPKPRSVARVDDRRVLSGIIHSFAMAYAGAMLRPTIVHARRFTIDGLDGPTWESLHVS